MSSSISWNKPDPSYLMFALWLRMVKYLNSVFEFIFFCFQFSLQQHDWHCNSLIRLKSASGIPGKFKFFYFFIFLYNCISANEDWQILNCPQDGNIREAGAATDGHMLIYMCKCLT